MTSNLKKAKKKVSTFDEEVRKRDEVGKLMPTERDTIAIKVPRAYQGYVRSRLLEICANTGLFILWDYIKNSTNVENLEDLELNIYREFLKPLMPESDVVRLSIFFVSDYWKNVVQDRTKNDFKEMIDNGIG